LEPIVITKNEFISGLHKLKAAKVLDLNEIECITMSYNNIDKELAEIDKNLIMTE
jgi:hypothetical protein